MKNVYVLCTLLILAGCSGEEIHPNAVTNATITEFITEECYCCPSVTLETSEGTYTVDEFPDFTFEENELPVDVLVVLKDYEGECPGRVVSAEYLN